jgi:hypothetical protein
LLDVLTYSFVMCWSMGFLEIAKPIWKLGMLYEKYKVDIGNGMTIVT